MFTSYVIGLTAAIGLAGFAGATRGGSTLPLSACALLYNWAINQAVVTASGDPNPWQAFVATDGMCFAFVGALCVSAGTGLARAGSGLLALTYAAQLAINLTADLGSPDARWEHWLTLTWIAFGQIAIVIAWAVICLGSNHARQP